MHTRKTFFVFLVVCLRQYLRSNATSSITEAAFAKKMQSLKIFRNLIIKLKERAWEVESPVQNNFFGDDEFIKSFE